MLFDLSQFGLLKVQGNDAKKFLQGQLTGDLELLAEKKIILTAHCNPQGRILSLFYLIFFEDCYFLFLPNNMKEITIQALSKYKIFYKVTLEDVSSQYEIKGLLQPEIKITSDILYCLPTDHSRYLFIALATDQKRLATFNQVIQQIEEKNLPVSAWNIYDIDKGIPTIYPQTSGKLLPHDINLHKLDVINFQKGCYTGQEIIARMHYRGKLKKQLYKTVTECDIQPLPGELLYSAESECGMIIDSAYLDKNQYALLLMIEESRANHVIFFGVDKKYQLKQKLIKFEDQTISN